MHSSASSTTQDGYRCCHVRQMQFSITASRTEEFSGVMLQYGTRLWARGRAEWRIRTSAVRPTTPVRFELSGHPSIVAR